MEGTDGTRTRALQDVEAQGPAEVDDREVGRRPHGADSRGHRADRAVGHGEEEDALAWKPESLAGGHEPRLRGARQAAAEIAAARDRQRVRRR
jgi:hypothetical protein